MSKLLRNLIREILAEVDVDPSNNPGRPADAFDYVGMRPKASMAMAHPNLTGEKLVDIGSSGGSGGSTAGSSTSASAPSVTTSNTPPTEE